jgi:hypothetical protein
MLVCEDWTRGVPYRDQRCVQRNVLSGFVKTGTHVQ